MSPVAPVLGRAPVSDSRQRAFPIVQGLPLPGRGVVIARETIQLAAHGVAEQLGAIDTEAVGPFLHLTRFCLIDPETQHRHT